MNERNSFWKGFLLAGGLSIVFWAGRVTAGPIPSPTVLDDTSRAIEKCAEKLDRIADRADKLASSVESIKSDGVQVRGAYNALHFPIGVKSSN